MRSVGELIVRVADLMEAEGRVARRNIVRLIFISVILVTAAMTLVAGILSLGAAVFLGLNSVMHPGWALAIVAFALIALGLFVTIVGTALFRQEGRIL